MSWLLWIITQWIWECRCVCKILIPAPLETDSEVGLLDLMIVLFLIFTKKLYRNFILFSIEATLTYIPTNNKQGFPFSPMLTNACYFLSFLIIAIQIDISRNFCCFPWTWDRSHFPVDSEIGFLRRLKTRMRVWCVYVCMLSAPIGEIRIICLARLSWQEPCLFTAVSMEPRAVSGISGFLAYVRKGLINQGPVVCSATSRL